MGIYFSIYLGVYSLHIKLQMAPTYSIYSTDSAGSRFCQPNQKPLCRNSIDVAGRFHSWPSWSRQPSQGGCWQSCSGKNSIFPRRVFTQFIEETSTRSNKNWRYFIELCAGIAESLRPSSAQQFRSGSPQEYP